VREKLPKRDRIGICFRDCEIEVTIGVAIKVEFALLDQLHHGCGGK
jgi:hypothetical protein